MKSYGKVEVYLHSFLTPLLDEGSVEPHAPVLDPLGKAHRYGSSYSTKTPASGIATVGEPRLMSKVGRMREDVCA
jgi:hypothetical protein